MAGLCSKISRKKQLAIITQLKDMLLTHAYISRFPPGADRVFTVPSRRHIAAAGSEHKRKLFYAFRRPNRKEIKKVVAAAEEDEKSAQTKEWKK